METGTGEHEEDKESRDPSEKMLNETLSGVERGQFFGKDVVRLREP